ncbi:MAG: hypothetical protein AXA67_14085 [Methylothermaceae bacteria B42]|nr:MAG: hypothetical protein AXA67_14085 [Methylothermaceae bacteria B42]
MNRKYMGLKGLLLGLAYFFASQANAVPVGLELALLVDVSGSVNNSEYNLQKTGYVNAFKDPALASILPTNGIAVTYIEWSGSSQQAQLVDWTHITDATSASNFGDDIAATSRAFGGSTAPGSAINFAVPKFNNNGFEGVRLVIDVSGDGRQNSGANTANARDAALAAGIDAINGLPILTDDPSLDTWYQNNVVGGTGAFLLTANNFSDFAQAIQQKIKREVGGGGGGTVPEPATMFLFAIGLVGFGIQRKKS